ncbi:MAG: NADH dehydrogenase (quinone) subunit D [Thermodesulfobacteriota bacterium]
MTENNTMILNVGPHHPATHGVLRVEMELDGETIVRAKPHVGYLHRGFEKLAESRTAYQNIPLTDRLDYSAASLNNLGYCLAVENLMGIEVPKRAQYIRVIMGELARIMGHQLWLGTHALDMGAMTPIFYTFADRELAMSLTEDVSGYRLTPSFLRIGGVSADIGVNFLNQLRDYLNHMKKAVDTYHKLLTDNIIWKRRTRDVGVITDQEALSCGLTGPCLRATGLAHDIRKLEPYSSYSDFDFQVPVGEKGDAYDRYLVRMEEFNQSLRIIEQAMENMPRGPVMSDDPRISIQEQESVQNCADALIRRFKVGSNGFEIPPGEFYQSVEGAKGELGFYLVGNGDTRPYRLKMRSPCYYLISALPRLLEGHMIADAITVIGSIDIILGEVDR